MKVRSRIAPASSMVTALFVAVAGCAPGDETPEDVEVQTGAVSVYPRATGSDIQYGTMYTWPRNGLNNVPVLAGANNACFLNSVWGKFHIANDIPDEVDVALLADGTWVIGGQATGDGTPSGDAFCIRNVAPTALVAAKTGESKPMGVDAATHSCFLTSIGGGFDSAGSYARVRKSGSQWLLEVSGGTFKRATAQCVPIVAGAQRSVSAPGGEVQLLGTANDSGIIEEAINTSSKAPYFCALTNVQGILVGPDQNWVGTYLKPQADGTFAWKLGRGTFSTFPVSASARCLR